MVHRGPDVILSISGVFLNQNSIDFRVRQQSSITNNDEIWKALVEVQNIPYKRYTADMVLI